MKIIMNFERFEIREKIGSEHMRHLLDSRIRKKRTPPYLFLDEMDSLEMAENLVMLAWYGIGVSILALILRTVSFLIKFQNQLYLRIDV